MEGKTQSKKKNTKQKLSAQTVPSLLCSLHVNTGVLFIKKLIAATDFRVLIQRATAEV